MAIFDNYLDSLLISEFEFIFSEVTSQFFIQENILFGVLPLTFDVLALV